jgi:hypothetical protein
VTQGPSGSIPPPRTATLAVISGEPGWGLHVYSSHCLDCTGPALSSSIHSQMTPSIGRASQAAHPAWRSHQAPHHPPPTYLLQVASSARFPSPHCTAGMLASCCASPTRTQPEGQQPSPVLPVVGTELTAPMQCDR